MVHEVEAAVVVDFHIPFPVPVVFMYVLSSSKLLLSFIGINRRNGPFIAVRIEGL